MEIRHLRSFIAVAEELHFNRAAERLHVAQPALSATIKALEQELGVTLLNRTTRSVSMTVAGELFLDHARHAVGAFDDVRTVGEQLRHGRRGVISVGSSSQVRQLLGSILYAFHQRYPYIETALREQGTSQVLEAVLGGELDVGVGLAPEGRDGICSRTLNHDELLVIVADDHPLAARASVPLTALRDETILLPSSRRARGSNSAIVALCERAGFTPRVSYGQLDQDQRFQSVTAGQGVALRATDYMVGLAGAGVTPLRLDPVASLPVDIFWRTGRVTPSVTRFVEIALKVAAAGLAASVPGSMAVGTGA